MANHRLAEREPQRVGISVWFGWSNGLLSGQRCHLAICSSCPMDLACRDADCCPRASAYLGAEVKGKVKSENGKIQLEGEAQ